MSDLAENVGQRLEQALRESGRTQRALATHCGVKPQAVSKWFRTGHISARSAARAARFLGVDLSWLLTGQPGDAEPRGAASAAVETGGDRAYTLSSEMDGVAISVTVRISREGCAGLLGDSAGDIPSGLFAVCADQGFARLPRQLAELRQSLYRSLLAAASDYLRGQDGGDDA